jgi:cytoskeletal protein RodZ
VPGTQGNPTLYQLNVLKEKAVTALAFPKGIERLTTLSYPQPNEDPYQSSDDEEDEVSSSGSGPNDSGSSSDEESSQTDSNSESYSDSSCDEPKSKKRSKAKAKSKYTHSKKSNKPKKCKAKQSKKKATLKTKSKKTMKKLEVTVALDLGNTAEEGDLYWQHVSNDPEHRMVSNSGGDFIFYVKYQNIIDELEPEDNVSI